MEPIRKNDRYTVRDYKSWLGDERWELIDGAAHAMSPAPRLSHQKLVVEMLGAFSNYLKDKPCQVFVSPVDVYLFGEDDGEDTVVQPDIVVVCDKTKLNERGVIGAPDLVVEILSPSTAMRDTMEKLRLYQRAGVQEYWIVAPDERSIALNTLEKGIYSTQSARQNTLASVFFPDFSIDVSALFDSLEDLVNEPKK